MFESDEWDLGDDFLNDFDNANTSFDEGDRTNLKKRKLDNSETIFSSALTSQNVSKQTSQSKPNDEKAKKKNKVLELFKKPDDASQISSVPQITPKDNGDSMTSQSSQAFSKRQRVAELFESGNPVEKTQKVPEPVEKTVVTTKETSSQPEPSKIILTAKPGPSTRETNWLTQKKDIPKPIKDVIKLQHVKATNLDERRKNILDCFKKSETSVVPKRALVRKFPGPAGLLFADSDDSPVPMEILDTDSANEDSPRNFDSTTFCSQRTKNLFTEGAWQLMLADLPDNFLKGYDIANIKQKAKSKKFNQKKVPFMAGIVQSIDYSSNNPKIVLKDFSGEIECCVHCKITSKYPNVLEYGNVVLLRDVGIIASNMYMYAMASLNSLVSIYTHKERVVDTPNLEMIRSGRFIDGEEFEFENFDDKFPSVRLEKKVEEQTTESLDKDESLDFMDDFFEKEPDSNKENKETESPNLQTSFNFDTSFDKDPPMPFGCSTQREPESTQKTSEPTTIQPSSNTNVETINNLFDMDDEAFFAVDEHISQVEQSFFSSTETTKIGLFKCKTTTEDKVKTPTTESPVKNQSSGNKNVANLKRFALQKKVPSALLNSTVKNSDVQKEKGEKSVAEGSDVRKEKAEKSSEAEKKNEKSDLVVIKKKPSSAREKLLQFEKQDEGLVEDTQPLVPVSSQFNDREDLFSCDDDILMSQMELDYL